MSNNARNPIRYARNHARRIISLSASPDTATRRQASERARAFLIRCENDKALHVFADTLSGAGIAVRW